MRNNLTVDMGVYELLAVLGMQAASYLEVGTYEGGSLRAVLSNPERHPHRVVCCDSWTKRIKEGKPGGHAHVNRMLSEVGYRGSIRFLEGDSAELIPTLSEEFDLTLVDADHREEACASDLALVWPLTTGAMVIHDVWLKMGVRTALWRFIRGLAPGASAAFCGGDHGTIVLFR